MTLTSIKTAIAKPGRFLIPLVAASALALAGCAGQGNKQTGGTLVGVTQGLDDAGCDVTPILARPIDTGLMADVECSSFSGRIPGVVDGLSTIFASADLPNLKEIEVSDSEAIEVTRQLIRSGFPVGPSSGLNYLAAVRAIEQHPSPAPVAVTVFPDRMERYFSTELFANNPTTSNS